MVHFRFLWAWHSPFSSLRRNIGLEKGRRAFFRGLFRREHGAADLSGAVAATDTPTSSCLVPDTDPETEGMEIAHALDGREPYAVPKSIEDYLFLGH